MILSELQDSNVGDIIINRVLLKDVTSAFYEVIKEKKIEIPESYVQNILVSIVLMIQRSKTGNSIHLEGNNQVGKLFLEFNKYPLVYDILKAIEDRGIYQFSMEETQYLTYLIVGSGLNFFMKQENIPVAFRKNVRKLIHQVSEDLQIDVRQDGPLEENLLVHLYQLILRMEAQISIMNPLIDEIKKNYPSLYGVVWLGLADFCKSYQIDLSDDEVGFITIHFQAAIERLKKMNKILFVCPNGVGTSSFVSAKIRRILPNIDSIETTSLSQLRAMDLSDVDFIISTIPVPIKEKPVIQITPMVTAEDMKKIMNKYIDLVIERETLDGETRELSMEERKQVIRHTLFTDFSTKEEALKTLIDQQKFSSDIQKRQFIASVFEREAVQSTYLDNGFAIPHGNPKFVEKTSVSIAILDKPILWGKQNVDIIVLLMVKEEDRNKVEAVMNLVMQGIKNKNWFISKMMEVNK